MLHFRRGSDGFVVPFRDRPEQLICSWLLILSHSDLGAHPHTQSPFIVQKGALREVNGTLIVPNWNLSFQQPMATFLAFPAGNLKDEAAKRRGLGASVFAGGPMLRIVLVGWLVGWLVGRSVGRWVGGWVGCRSVGRSVGK